MTNSNSSISKHYHQLTSVQRGQIQAMLDSGITSRTVIAQEVGCHKSTISREIKRGSVLQRDSSYLFFFFKQKTAYEISACLVGSEMCIRDRAEEAPLLRV